MLVITNGDSAVGALDAAGVSGQKLAWSDVLHDGPVPAHLALPELSDRRAEFIAGCGWGDLSVVRAGFRARDAVLASSHTRDEVVLWFEHDLYDQLQLLQLLDWFAEQPRPRRLSMICEERYVAETAPEELKGLIDRRRAVAPKQLDYARRAWAAFRADKPTGLPEFANATDGSLPFVAPAIGRLLQEYPAPGSGLSRTERQLLEAVRSGAGNRREAFTETQRREEARFLGDWSFFRYVDALREARQPLLAAADGPDGVLSLTPHGERVLDGGADRIATSGIDRWIGGVHLRPDNAWRWDGSEFVST